MADKFSVDDLLSEYNDKLERFDANKFAEQKRRELELEEQMRREKELEEQLRKERELKEQQAFELLMQQQGGQETAAQPQQEADTEAESTFEQLGPVIEQEEQPMQPIEQAQPVIEPKQPQTYLHKDVTQEFDSQPDQWVPADDEVQYEAEAEPQPVQETAEPEPVIPDEPQELQAEQSEQAEPPEMAFEEDMQQVGGEEEEEVDFETQARELGLDEKDIEMLRKKRNAATIKNLSKMKKQKAKRGENVSPKNRASLKDIKLGLTGKIIPKTEEFDKSQIPDPNTSYEERTEFLTKRRRRKVENFRLDPDDEEMFGEDGETRSPSRSDKEEFESFEQAPELLAEILELRNSLRRRLTVLFFSGVICALLALANDFGIGLLSFLDRTQSPAVYTVINVMLGAVAVFEGYTVLAAGVKNLTKGNADCDSLAAIGLITAMISGTMALFSTGSVAGKYYHIYISAAMIGLVFNTVGKLMIVGRTENNFRYIAGAYDRYAVKTVENEDVAANFTQGYVEQYPVLAKMQKTEFVKGFMKNSYCTDVSDTLARRISPMILLCGLLLGLLSFVCDKNPVTPVDKIITALAAFAGTVSMCSSMALILIVNIPMTKASRQYLQHSAIMLGYNSVDEFAQTNSVLVEAKQLFPTGMVDFVNLKMLSTTSIDECLLMAASLSSQADSVLKSAFYKMLMGKTEMLYPVESYIYEDGQGLSGWIENKRILLGTRELMENHSIEGLPSEAKEKEIAGNNVAVYLSISGVVTTLFVVRALASPSIKGWMQELENEGIVTVIRTVDSFLTKDFICRAFGVDKSSVKFLPFRYHKDYDEQTDYAPKVDASVICSGHFESLAMLILGAKKLKAAADLGIAFQFGGVVMGALLCLIMSVTGSFSQITASAVLGYNLLLVLVSLIVNKIKKV